MSYVTFVIPGREMLSVSWLVHSCVKRLRHPIIHLSPELACRLPFAGPESLNPFEQFRFA